MEWFYRVSSIQEKYAGTDELPDYVQFFRELRKQESYQEEELKKAFPANNFSELKARVRDIIYKGVHFYSQSPAKIRSNESVEIEWLISKGFVVEARKQIQKAKKRVIKEEEFLGHLVLLDIEADLNISDSSVRLTSEQIEQHSRERSLVLQKYNNLQEFIGLYQEIHGKIKSQFTPQGKLAESSARGILDHPLMQNQDMWLSNRSRLYGLRLKYIAHYLQGGFGETIDLLLEIVSNFEGNRFLMSENESEYLLRKCQLALSLNSSGRWQEGGQHLQVFKKRFRDHPLHFTYFFNIQLDGMLIREEYEEWGRLKNSFEKGMAKFEGQIPLNRKYILWLLVARIHFRLGEFKMAIRFVQKVIDHSVRKFREDIQGTARLLLVLLYFELDDQDGMEYSIRLSSQFLYRRKAIFPFERAMLNFFRLAVRETAPSDRLTALESLQDRTNDLLEEDSTLRAFHFFDYAAWIEETIQRLKADRPG